MVSVLWRWFAATVAIFATPYVVPGVSVANFPAAATMALVLGLLNVLVKPLLVLLTLPITVLTLGLFWLVINAVLFQWAGHLVEGVHVTSFGAALLASLFVSAASWLAHALVRRPRVRVVWRTTPTEPRPRRASIDGEETIELHDNGKGKWE